MLAHGQFPAPALVEIGWAAAQAGFGVLTTSDHLPAVASKRSACRRSLGHLSALGPAHPAWVGTTVTCPILRYHPAVVAQTFATSAQFNPGRVFLGVGSGEALNEEAATSAWPSWAERWERLVDAIAIIGALWIDPAARAALSASSETQTARDRKRSSRSLRRG
jgi:alkanesulfonate monooxygenase SsuD/methylene tetrahydromethanopterin reductase-like flavin-dependent oxidoreductase (luciferase family)